MLNKCYTVIYTPCKVNIVDRLKDIICYISVPNKNASHGMTPEQKMFRGRTKVMLLRAGTVPVPVLVLSLATRNTQWLYKLTGAHCHCLSAQPAALQQAWVNVWVAGQSGRLQEWVFDSHSFHSHVPIPTVIPVTTANFQSNFVQIF